MKKLLFALALVCLLPAMAFAAGAGGSANEYHVQISKICTQAGAWVDKDVASDSCASFTLLAGTTGSGSVGAPETTCVMNIENCVNPHGAGAWMSYIVDADISDSLGVLAQFSPDGVVWVNSAAAPGEVMVGTVDTDEIVEAATALTSPVWKYARWILQAYDGSDKANSIPGVTIWVMTYRKDQ